MKVTASKSKRPVRVKLQQAQSKYTLLTEKDDPKLPGVIVFSGSRGSGKTYACVMMVRHFEQRGYVTRTFLLCPTRASNDVYSNLRTLHDRDVCDDEDEFQAFLDNVLRQIQSDWRSYEEHKVYASIYRKYQSDPESLSLKEMMVLEHQMFNPPRGCLRPSHVLIVDDAQGTEVFSNKRKDLLNHMVIKHRHIPLTLCLLAQSWVGIPRVIRLNTTQFAVYKTGDKLQLKQIYNSFANTISYPHFEHLYRAAVSEPNGFLFIDTDPKKEHQRFRSGFNQYLNVKEK